jgi:hypothetical protein
LNQRYVFNVLVDVVVEEAFKPKNSPAKLHFCTVSKDEALALFFANLSLQLLAKGVNLCVEVGECEEGILDLMTSSVDEFVLL